MTKEEEIQQKADTYASILLRSSSTGEYNGNDIEDAYTAGYKQCQQDMLNGNVLIGQMEYNRLVRKAENVKTTDV